MSISRPLPFLPEVPSLSKESPFMSMLLLSEKKVFGSFVAGAAGETAGKRRQQRLSPAVVARDNGNAHPAVTLPSALWPLDPPPPSRATALLL